METKNLFGWGFASVIVFALVFGAAQQGPQAENGAQMVGSADTSVAVEYFPAQFVNQGKEIEAHIQAF